MERLIGTGNGWALSLDDQDVCQLLPVRSDQFVQGVRDLFYYSCPFRDAFSIGTRLSSGSAVVT